MPQTRPKRVVIKIGTGVLLDAQKNMDHQIIQSLAQQIVELHKEQVELVVVSSGAVGAGRESVRLKKMEESIQKKVFAAVGQSRLMRLYKETFDAFSIPVAQVLLLREDFHQRERYVSIRTILEKLIENRIIPIINENDVIASADLCFSDNDNLAALVAIAIKADHLMILSDVEGLYAANPKENPGSSPIPVIPKITPLIKSYCSKSTSGFGLGGMINKVSAIEMATKAGIAAHICYGRKKQVILQCFQGKNPGTYFMPQKKVAEGKYMGKKAWLAVGVVPSGGIVVDEGALKALKGHKSLLAVGIKEAIGTFKKGDVVTIFDEARVPHGTGMVEYGSARLHSAKASSGSRKIFKKPVIHVDHLVIW